MRQITKSILFSLLIIGFMSVTARATEINDAGAARLKTLFTEFLENQKIAMQISGGSLVLDGDITLEQADTYYAVNLPSIDFISPHGDTHKIGLIAVNATPTDNPNNWKMSVAMPTPIITYDKNQNPLKRIDIGSQQMGGVWNGELNSFSKLVARYNDLQFSNYSKAGTLKLKQIDFNTDMKQAADKTWAGPFQMIASGVNLDTPQTPDMINIKDIKLKSTIDGYSPKTHKTLLKELKETLDSNATLDQSILKKIFANTGNAFSVLGALNGLEIDKPATTNQAASKFSIDSTSFNIDIAGMKSGLIDYKTQFGLRGLSTPTSKNHYKELFPKTFNLDLTLDKLPLEDLITVIDKSLPKGKNTKSSRQVAALQAMMSLPQILSKAGTTLSLKDTSIASDTYSADLNGLIKANPQSIMGATGTMNATFTGLEDTIQLLQKKLKNENSLKTKEKIESNIKRLNVLQSISKKEGNKSICNLVLDEKAKISINGQDVSGLLGLLAQ